MENLKVLDVRGQRVLTSKQIADCYETTTDVIKQNFSANRKRFVEEKHYISFTGDELKAFKNEVRNSHLVGNRASHLYLWTEKGALLHAKSLNTDKAWEVYDYLVDFYFRATKEEIVPIKKEIKAPEVVSRSPAKREGIDIAPLFRQVLVDTPIETLDEMEKVFRPGKDKSIKLATVAILSEKIKRQIV